MTLQETIAEIKRQGGLVYVPHPFDRMHSVPDYEHLLDVLDDVDAIEVFNPRDRDRRVQRRGGAVRGQVPDPGRAPAPTRTCRRGSARCGSGCATSTAPRSSCESLRDADIVRNPASLLYVQALKFLQTKALPESARRASRDRRVRRVTRKS